MHLPYNIFLALGNLFPFACLVQRDFHHKSIYFLFLVTLIYGSVSYYLYGRVNLAQSINARMNFQIKRAIEVALLIVLIFFDGLSITWYYYLSFVILIVSIRTIRYYPVEVRNGITLLRDVLFAIRKRNQWIDSSDYAWVFTHEMLELLYFIFNLLFLLLYWMIVINKN